MEDQHKLKEIKLEELRLLKGVEDTQAGRYQSVSNREESDQLIEEIKQKGKTLFSTE